jgi:hypothetical protein
VSSPRISVNSLKHGRKDFSIIDYILFIHWIAYDKSVVEEIS